MNIREDPVHEEIHIAPVRYCECVGAEAEEDCVDVRAKKEGLVRRRGLTNVQCVEEPEDTLCEFGPLGGNGGVGIPEEIDLSTIRQYTCTRAFGSTRAHH